MDHDWGVPARRVVAWWLSFLFPMLTIPAAAATEITVLCPRGAQTPVTEAAEAFTRESGTKVQFVFGTAGGLRAKAAAGDIADIVIASAAGVEDLIRRVTVVPAPVAT